MKKRFLSIVLTLCMVLTLVPTTALALQTDTEGVYQIGTKEDLYTFAKLVNSGKTNANAVLTADIVVNKGVLKADGSLADDTSGFTSWTPIGNFSKKYTGTFDGQGHTISGLYFNDTRAEDVGLFGSLGEGGEIKNVGVIDSYFAGNNYVGGVCGWNNSTITGCYNTGTVSSSGDVGGVCGDNFGGTIIGCYNTGTVSSSGDVGVSNRVGGVCGQNYYGTITGCYNTGTVSCSGNIIGGVCGNNYGTITGCYNTGTVSGNDYVGGVCGWNDGKIIGCYSIGSVSDKQYVGQYVGGVCEYNSGTITGCYTNRSGDTYYKPGEEFANGTVCGLLNTALQNANSKVRFCQGTNYPEFFPTPQLVDGMYQISSVPELYGFAQLVNGGTTNANAVLTADIVVNTGVLKADGSLADDTSGFTDWPPIGNDSKKYTGTFDGQGHTISGLYFNNTSTDYVGLFCYLGENG